jgi:flavin-dependent dehydrogenase
VVNRDVLIVGGGPSGLAAAIAARQNGLSVAVLDAARPPVDKPCGEGLMPDGVEALSRLGIRLGANNSAPFAGIRFVNGRTAARAVFPGVRGRGVRRTTLHSLMVERAADAGVTMFWNTPFHPDRLPVSARWVVGADGMHSRVRHWAGFDAASPAVRRFGFRRHFPVAPWSDTVDVHWGRDCQVYVTPVGQNDVCVAAISRHRHLRLDEALRSCPEVQAHLRTVLPTTAERGSVTECRQLPRVARRNIALVGDASGTVDALTGEGLALSFKQAFALADALAAEDLERYNAAHRRLMRTPAFMARLMLLMDERAWLRRPVVGALAASPAAFSKLLSLHIGASAPETGNLPCVQITETT